jgi:hypothetical protein
MVGGKEAYVTPTGAFVVDPFPGRSATPAHAVQEIWEGDVTIAENLKKHERFILIREGTQIRGYAFIHSNQPAYGSELNGQAAQDGSFSMADEDGNSWKGQFLSAVVIKGAEANAPESSVKEFPMRLRLVRDATADELPKPLPPTSSDWNAFLASFKAAVQRRDSGALIGMMARDFDFQNQSFRTSDEALAHVNWDQLDKALARGVETSRTLPGRKVNQVVDEHPCPTCVYQIIISFRQGGDNQWRWAGVAYPGDAPPQPDSSSIVTGLAAANMIIAANPDVEVLNTNDRERTITVRDKKTGKVVKMTFDEVKGAFEKRR